MKHRVVAASLVALASSALLGCSGGLPPATAPAATTTPGRATTMPAATRLRYAALGDSYTIGTSVGEAERWPNRLVEALAGDVTLELVANLAVNGATSHDVISRQLPRLTPLQPDFVSLLVGVNDVVRGLPMAAYTTNLATILDELLAIVPAGRIMVVSTPDYTRTPRGVDFGDPSQQRAAIARFNAIARQEAAARGIAFVDISDVADRAGDDPTLVATDGLHPSGRQYALWVERIAPLAAQLLAP